MTRLIHDDTATAARQPVVRLVAAVELDFAGGMVRACSAPFSLSFDGDGDGIASEFFGVGNLGRISFVQEAAELQAYQTVVSLSSVPSEMLAIALGEHYQGRPGKIWLLLVDSDDRSIVGDPILVFQGRIDTMDIERGATGEIDVTLINALADWERPRGGRFNDATHQSRWPGDKFFEFVEQSVEKQIVWGRE